MAPCTVLTTSSCGVRTNLRTVRRATWAAVVTALAGRPARVMSNVAGARVGMDGLSLASIVVMVGSGWSGGVGRGVVVVGVAVGVGDRLTGEGEEDLVEGRSPQPDVVDLDVDAVDRAHRVGDGRPAVGHRDGHLAGDRVDPRGALTERGERVGQPGQVASVAGGPPGPGAARPP